MKSDRSPGQAAGGREDLVDIGRIFDALGDPTRRAIVDRLRQGPLSVSSLAAPLQISLTAVGQHLQVLEETGLVHTEKLGRVRTCRLDPTGFLALHHWVQDHRSNWEHSLDRLGELLAESDDTSTPKRP